MKNQQKTRKRSSYLRLKYFAEIAVSGKTQEKMDEKMDEKKKKKNKVGNFIGFLILLTGLILILGVLFSIILFIRQEITIITILGFIGALFALGFFGYCTIGYLNRLIEDFGEIN